MALADAILGELPSLEEMVSRGIPREMAAQILRSKLGSVGPDVSGADTRGLQSPAVAPSGEELKQILTPAQGEAKPTKPDSDSKRITNATKDVLERYGSAGFGKAFDAPGVRLSSVLDAADLSRAELPEVTKPGALEGVRRADSSVPQPEQGPGLPRRVAGAVGGGVAKVGRGIADAMSQLGDISPETQFGLGQLAQAIGGQQDPRVRPGLGQRLGQVGAQHAQQRVMAKALNGEELSNGELAVLTPQQLIQIAQLQIQGRAEQRQAASAASNIGFRAQQIAESKKRGEEIDARIEQMGKGAPKTIKTTVTAKDGQVSEETWEFDKESQDWKVLSSTKLTDVEAAKAAAEATTYKAADIRLADNSIAEVFFPFAREIQGDDFNFQLGPEGGIAPFTVRGAIRSDPLLGKTFDYLKLRQVELMSQKMPLAEITQQLQAEAAEILPDPQTYTWPPAGAE